MSFADLNTPAPKNHIVHQLSGTRVILNTVLSDSVKRALAGFDIIRLIHRCDSLPEIEGDAALLTELFDHLVRMIFRTSVPGHRLFLFVDCCTEIIREEKTAGRLALHQIRFHTNVTVDEDWKSLNAGSLDRCNFIAGLHRGKLAVHNIVQTGCLFTLSLPGKKHSDAFR